METTEERLYYFKKNQIVHYIEEKGTYVEKYRIIARLSTDDSEVYLASDLKTNEEVILKAELIYNKSKLKKEWEIYDILKQCKDFDIVLNQFVGIEHRFLIMKRKGIDLKIHYLNLKKANVWDNGSHLRLYGIQMIEWLEKIHSFGVVHLDPKPNNFVLDENNDQRIHLIDFDGAKLFADSKLNHIPHKTLEYNQISGNRIYISMFGHNCEEQSRRDDLIFLGFSLIWMSRRGLPWSRTSRKRLNLEPNQYNDYIRDEKQKHCSTDAALERLCHRFPNLAKYMKHCFNLKFEEKPNYEFLKSLFE